MVTHEPTPNKGQDEGKQAQSINPIFAPLQLVAHLEQKEKELQKKRNPFPVAAFPEPVQEILRATNESLNFPIDFTGTAILFAVSVAIGNTYRIKVKSGWTESALLYLALVGRPGTNKSHPLSFALSPLESRDARAFTSFKEEMQRYNEIMKLPKADREQQVVEEPKKPSWQQLLLTDFTIEALIEVMKHNGRGVGVYADELAAWLNNFNRYNKGSEEQFWLSNWSGKTVRTNRKTSDPNFIEIPFASVCGTIQPGVIKELMAGKKDNGFIDRLLFAIPENLRKESWNDSELAPEVKQQLTAILDRLLNLPLSYDDNGSIVPQILSFTPEARAHLFQWQRQMTEAANRAENEAEAGIYAKLEVYAVRLALCLELLSYACNSSTSTTVGMESVKGALQLAEYFRRTALSINEANADSTSAPLRRLSAKERALYESLPSEFSTAEGVRISVCSGTSESTFKRFIQKKELFEKLEHGQYKKTL